MSKEKNQSEQMEQYDIQCVCVFMGLMLGPWIDLYREPFK